MWHRSNLAAKESGPECPHANNDHFTVLASGGSGRCWVSMCTVWPSHSKWLSKSASDFALSLNIPPRKLFGWFRRPQLWAKMIGSFITTMCPLIHHILSGFFFVKHQFTQVTQPYYSPDLALCNFWLFPKLFPFKGVKSLLKGKRFQTVNEIQENMMGQLMAIGRFVWDSKVTRWLLWRGLRCHCPKYNVFCILYLPQ